MRKTNRASRFGWQRMRIQSTDMRNRPLAPPFKMPVKLFPVLMDARGQLLAARGFEMEGAKQRKLASKRDERREL